MPIAAWPGYPVPRLLLAGQHAGGHTDSREDTPSIPTVAELNKSTSLRHLNIGESRNTIKYYWELKITQLLFWRIIEHVAVTEVK